MTIGAGYGLEADDIASRGMGQNGVDVILSPAARRVFDLDIECKNQESLNVTTEFKKHWEKYMNRPSLKMLVHTKNFGTPLVTIRWEDFLTLLGVDTNYRLRTLGTKQ